MSRVEYMRAYREKKKREKQLLRIQETPSENDLTFTLEKYLEEDLFNNWKTSFFGKEYDIYETDGISGRQFQTDNGRIDILAISKDGKRLLVIELKKGMAGPNVIGQTLKYMSYVQEKIAFPGQEVIGAIVAFGEDKALSRALNMIPTIKFYHYEISPEAVLKPVETPLELPKTPLEQAAQSAPIKENIKNTFSQNIHRAILIVFIAANTVFLGCEQVMFYQTCGYSFGFSIFLALLLEGVPLSLAYFASVYKKPLLNVAILPAIFCIGAVIYLGLEFRSNTAINVTRATGVLESQIQLLQEQAVDADGKKLEKIQKDILKKQEELRREIPKNNTDASSQFWIFAMIRFFAFIYNLIFAKLLGSS